MPLNPWPGVRPMTPTPADSPFRLPPPGEWFPCKITDEPSTGEYTFDEVWLDGDGSWVTKSGGRVGTADRHGVALVGTLAVDDYAWARAAPGAGGTLFELIPVGGSSGSVYNRVQDEGSDLTQRGTLNFVGEGVTAADDAGNTRTDVTVHDASATQTGCVNLTSQVMGDGDKGFQGHVTAVESVAVDDTMIPGVGTGVYADGVRSASLPTGLNAVGGTSETPLAPPDPADVEHVFLRGYSSLNKGYVAAGSQGTLAGNSIWIVPEKYDTDFRQGRVILAGLPGYHDPTDDTVYYGKTDTVSGLVFKGGLFHGGSVTGVGTVTSVDVSGGTTGLTFSGGPVTSSGTITMSGTLALANGGTGTSLTDPGGSALFWWNGTSADWLFIGPGLDISALTLVLKNWATVPDLTDSTGGSPSNTIGDVGASFSQSAINDNFASLTNHLQAIIDVLQAAGMIS